MKAIEPENFNKQSKQDIFCFAKGDTGASQHYWMKKDENKTQQLLLYKQFYSKQYILVYSVR